MDRIEEIKKKLELATKGEWLLKHEKMRHFTNDILANCEHCEEEPFVLAQLNRSMDNWKNDADFIAHSKSDIEFLLEQHDYQRMVAHTFRAELEQLHEKVKLYETALKFYADRDNYTDDDGCIKFTAEDVAWEALEKKVSHE